MKRIVTAREQVAMLCPWRVARWDDYEEEPNPYDDEGDHHPLDIDDDDFFGKEPEFSDDVRAQAEEDALKGPPEPGDYFRGEVQARRADAKNKDWATYANLIPPKDHGMNGPRPPLTMEPVSVGGSNGVMARHAADGRPVGFLFWNAGEEEEDPESMGEIDSVDVHPEFTRQGIAQAMLHHARSNPDIYRSGYNPIHHSRFLSPSGEAYARADPHHTMPPDEYISRINSPRTKRGDYASFLSAPGSGGKKNYQYVPGNVPYGDPNHKSDEAIWHNSSFTTGDRQYVPPGEGHVGEHMGEKAVTQKWARRRGPRGKRYIWPAHWDNKPHPDVPFPRYRMRDGDHPTDEEVLRRAVAEEHTRRNKG